jgi:hypothetical protein
MLKIVNISIAIATAFLLLFLFLIFTDNAQADVSEALQNICTIVKADDKGEFRKK